MRTLAIVTTAALVLASASNARAQQNEAAPPTTGTIDFGVRAFSNDGDYARMERYRDYSTGAATNIRFGNRTPSKIWSISAENIGYLDQRYLLNYNAGKMKVTGSWDSIPLNYTFLSSTPWTETSTGVFVLDNAAQGAVQAKVPGVVGVPQNVAQLSTPSIYRGLALGFDEKSRRDTAAAGFAYDMTETVGFSAGFTSTHKGGQQPYGMSFAFVNANELAMPLDNRANDVTTNLEWSNPQGMIRVGWDGSYYNNNIKSITWDNPLRLTDTTPYDPNGYSNGNGPAQGRMSVSPSNTMNTVSTSGNYKMAPRTTINGVLSFTAMSNNDALIPWTINPAIANPTVYKDFPGLAQLPRTTAEASVHGINGMMNFTSRPNNFFGLQMKYRFNDHKNLTPGFNAIEYVRFDAVPEEGGSISENFNIRQNTFDLIGTFSVAKYTNLRLGYTYDDVNREGRVFSDSREFTFRASVDTVGNQYMMLRATYEHGERVGSGFSEASLEDGGSQPGLRFYDEADRSRNKGSFLAVLTPKETFDFQVLVTVGRDEYSGPGHEYGLLNNNNTGYTIGANYMPRPNMSLGANYGWEKFTSFQASQNANPPGTDYGSWTDPNRLWTLDNDEKVNNFDLYLDLKQVAKNTNVRFDYIYSNSDNAFIHGGPRIQELATNTALTPGDTKPCAAGVSSCFIPLPNVTNAWNRVGADVTHYFTKKVGIGIADYYEHFDVKDFNTIDLPNQPGTPRIDYLGELNTGYGNRPYSGNVFYLRLLYSF